MFQIARYLLKLSFFVCWMEVRYEGFTAATVQWHCDNGVETIPEAHRCDEHLDCSDASDESSKYCPPRTCSADQFTCESGACVSEGTRCNGERDCPSGDDSDERECEEIKGTLHCDPREKMLCDNGTLCILLQWKCDHEKDCYDGSDEKDCVCPLGHFSCEDAAGECIDVKWVCDGEPDCANKRDESNCQPATSDRATATPPTRSRSQTLTASVSTSSTTTATTTLASPLNNCRFHEYPCRNGHCLPIQKFCDGKYDCGASAEDEHHCYETTCRSRNDPKSWTSTDMRNVCDQGCRQTPFGPKCFCLSGYWLEPDAVRCRAAGGEVPKIAFVENNKIYEMELGFPHFTEKVRYVSRNKDSVEIWGLDYISEDVLVWADHSSGKVYSINEKNEQKVLATAPLTNTNELSLIGSLFVSNAVVRCRSNQSPFAHIIAVTSNVGLQTGTFLEGVYGVACDWLTNNLYLTYKNESSNGKVAVIGLSRNTGMYDESKLVTFDNINVSRPLSIVVHPVRGKMIVADAGSTTILSTLILSDMDGSNVSTIHTDYRLVIHCVTIDYVNDIVYWSQSSTAVAEIWMMKLGGVQRKVLLTSKDEDIPFSSPLSLTVFENKVYFSDNRTREIWQIDSVSGKPVLGNAYSSKAIVKHVQAEQLMAVKTFHPVLRQNALNECSLAGCSHTCTLSSGGSTCHCPKGMLLVEKRCVDKSTLENSIMQPSQSSRLVASSNSTTTPRDIALKETAMSTITKKQPSIIFSKRCKKPMLVARSSTLPVKLDENDYDVGSTITYYCDEGYHIKGIERGFRYTITCINGGVWDFSTPLCVMYTCSLLECGLHGNCKTDSRYGAVCKCDNGHISLNECPQTSTYIANTTLGQDSKGRFETTGNRGKVAAIVVCLLVVIATCGFTLWRCLKKREYALVKKEEERGPIYNNSPAPRTSTPDNLSDRLHSLCGKDKGIANPNYSPNKKDKVRLPRPDAIDIDSGVDRSSSSLSSGESPGVYNFSSLKEASDAQLYTEQEEKSEVGAVSDFKDFPLTHDPRTDVKTTITSIFNLRKADSQECILPPV